MQEGIKPDKIYVPTNWKKFSEKSFQGPKSTTGKQFVSGRESMEN